MNRNQIANQMLAFKKFAFDNTCNVVALFQEQTEKMLNFYLDQATFLPKENKKMLTGWLDATKTGRELFKKMMDDGFKITESYFI